jgi:hypothetical protein
MSSETYKAPSAYERLGHRAPFCGCHPLRYTHSQFFLTCPVRGNVLSLGVMSPNRAGFFLALGFEFRLPCLGLPPSPSPVSLSERWTRNPSSVSTGASEVPLLFLVADDAFGGLPLLFFEGAMHAGPADHCPHILTMGTYSVSLQQTSLGRGDYTWRRLVRLRSSNTS